MPKIQELYRVSFTGTKLSSNTINGRQYLELPQRDFNLLLFWHALSSNEYTILQCNTLAKNGERFYQLVLTFLSRLRQIEQERNSPIYKLVKAKLDQALDAKLIECLRILYKVANKNYRLTQINHITVNELSKLEKYIINNQNPVGAEARFIKSANIRIRSFYRNANIFKFINIPGYCQQFKSLNELINALVIKDLEFTNSKYSEFITLPQNNRPLYDSKRGRYIMDLLKNKTRVRDYAIQDISGLHYNKFIKMINRPRTRYNRWGNE